MEHLVTTSYDYQTNVQDKRLNWAEVVRMRHFVVEHQCSWDMIAQSLTYAYNTQINHIEQRLCKTNVLQLQKKEKLFTNISV